MKEDKRSRQRIKLTLTTIVGLSFGAFVAVAIGLVLALSVSANFKNTFSLLNDKTILSTQALETQLRTHFSSIENAIVGLKPYFDNGTIGFERPERTLEDLTIALKSNSDITTLAVTGPDGRRIGVYRAPNGKIWRINSDAPPPGMTSHELPELASDSPPTWGALVKHEVGLFANVSVPLTRNGAIIGTLTAATSMEELGRIVSAQDEGVDNTVFIIADGDQVVLHSDSESLQTGGSIKDNIPGSWLNLGDPVLAAIATEEKLEEFKKAADLGIDVSFVTANDDEYIMMKALLDGFSDKPWTVGQYYLGTTVSREVRRLAGSMFVGFGALVVSVLIAFWMGRRVARPLKYLALQSKRVGTLSLSDVEPLPRSRVAEIDQVALAFNSMVEGLKAMNTYVPRSLFIKLMRLGGGQAAEAREAELTILFTDIVGFTALSEHLSAEKTAGLLNDHFAILVEAVEAEGGTVDKFLGDGMLAFWGAPDARPDHAEAAVRTARRIAGALHEANQKAEKEGRPQMFLRIGIHTGEAVVGNVGALDRWNYTVVGDTVNAAERLQTLGKEVPGTPEVTILASADTVAQLPRERHQRAVGAHHLRGRSGRMEVYWLDPFAVGDSQKEEPQELPVSAAE
ncbi:adenylate/guanylate cyclase domain-containing protein [Labrenzia sp. VG12]|uniref:adenylate/guanylate cyclase domain-containing protein n=1 Tax=Labrenzia sp. VG12 TaxID=2021862 RepID=UPI000B8BFCE8|nr:adenylate/guanylate cyclase domain-containing protein [Labrenzia sp. VG12]ASP31990.1 adenylate/guanylate cyclase domain-containing protein [Labrenzia sp. VG12]